MFQMDAIRWGNAGLWWLMLLPLLLVPAWVGYEVFRRRVERSFAGQGRLAQMVERPRAGRRRAAWACTFLALELVAVAAMRPRYGLKEVSVRGLGVDVAIVLDASRSMKATDVAPDRLTAATVEIERLLDVSRGNRFALVPFAGLAFVQSPLTVDYGVLREYLRTLKVTDLPVPGTALGRALRTAATALGLAGDGPATGAAHKALVVFTDGENHEGDPEKVVADLATKGVRVFTVGVGTPAGQPIPILDEKGQVTGTAREKDGVTPILSKLNEDLLKDLANRTGGKYLGLTGGSDVAGSLAAELNLLEKAEYQAQVDKLLEDRFQYPLGAAVVLMILPFLLLGGGRVRRAAAAAVLVAGLALPGSARAKAFEKDHAGVADALSVLAAGQAGDAAKLLADLAGSELPSRPDLLYDLALARDAAGQFPEAVEAADQALAALAGARESRPDWPTRARILHAKGTVLAHQALREAGEKKDARSVRQTWRRAADALTEALLADPSAADTRRNLELAATAAWPPCFKLDDKFEPNNQAGEAKFLTLDPNTLDGREDLLLCPDDQDWFRVPLNAGETLVVSVQAPPEAGAAGTPGAPGAGGAPQGEPQARPASVDVVLVDANGVPLGAPAKEARRRARAAEGVFLKVTGPKEEDGIPYVLDARIIPPCPRGDDGMEPNDRRDAAKALPDGDHGLRVCPGNEDWFTYTEKKGSQKEVVLQVPAGEGPLDLEVFSADGSPVDVVARDAAGGQVRSARLPKAEQDAPFTLRVAGGGAEGFYQLSVKDAQGNNGQDKQQDKQQDQKQDDPKDRQKQPESQQAPQRGSQTMRELLDAIDRNDENLEAKDAARRSPLRETVPEKDW